MNVFFRIHDMKMLKKDCRDNVPAVKKANILQLTIQIPEFWYLRIRNPILI